MVPSFFHQVHMIPNREKLVVPKFNRIDNLVSEKSCSLDKISLNSQMETVSICVGYFSVI